MLAGVLLHVVQPAAPVDAAFDLGAGEQRLGGQVPYLTLLILFYVDDRCFQTRAAGRGGDERAGVVGLAAAGGIEGAAVERDLPERSAASARALADVGHRGGELGECGVGVIEALGWHTAILEERGRGGPFQSQTADLSVRTCGLGRVICQLATRQGLVVVQERSWAAAQAFVLSLWQAVQGLGTPGDFRQGRRKKAESVAGNEDVAILFVAERLGDVRHMAGDALAAGAACPVVRVL